MTTNLYKHIVVVIITGLIFLAVNCSDKSEPGTHVHADGTIHSDDEHTSDPKTDEQGRSYHVHGDGSIHYLESSESRVSGSTINMPPEEIARYAIDTAVAGPGQLAIKTNFPGEIAINTNMMALIVPRVPGIVREVKVKLGDLVNKGDILAVIDSRDLADARAAYLASMERLALAQAMFDLKEKLWKKDISSEKEYLNTKKDLAQANIELRAAKQKLIAMGFTSTYLDTLPQESEELFTRYEVVAPFNCTIIKKNIALGRILKDDAEVFVVADLRTVWVNLQVYKKDLPQIRKGQHIRLVRPAHLDEILGIIDYVGPLVGTQTQTALARVVLPNPNGELRPGLFVEASVTVKRIRADVLIRSEYVQYLNDNPCIFKRVANGFELRGVELGDTDGEYVAIISGLKNGEKYATTNSFLLKAEMDESASNMHVHSDGTVHFEQK